MYSREEGKGSSRLTTNKLSLTIVAILKYLFTTFTIVSIFDGLVPGEHAFGGSALSKTPSLQTPPISGTDLRVFQWLLNGSQRNR